MTSGGPKPATGLTRARVALALAVLLHLVFLASLSGGYLDSLFNDSTHRGSPGTDFFVVWKAGKNILEGESPYRIDPDEPPRSWGDYRYLPLSAMTVSVALAQLPAETARAVWIVLSECLLALAIALTIRLARSPRDALVGAGLWLAFTPYYVELWIGQFDFLVAFGFLGIAAAACGRTPSLRPAAQAAWIVATAAKWNGLLIAPFMLRRRMWRPLAIWTVLAVATGVTWFALHPDDLASLRSTVFRGGFATPHAGNYGMQALVSSFMTAFRPDIFSDFTDRASWMAEHGSFVRRFAVAERAILLVAGGLALAATFFGRRALSAGEGIALWTALLAVGWNEFWEHQYVLLLPGLVLLYLEGRRVLALAVWWPLAMPTLFALVDRPHARIVEATPAGFDNPDLFLLLSTPENVLLHLTKAVPAAVLFSILVGDALRGRGSRGDPLDPGERTV